jgi:membrane-associated phospholipid phosphatase
VTRRPTVPLLVALACLLALALTGLLALDSPRAHERDAAMLHGFVTLDRPRVHHLVQLVAALADPAPYAAAGVLMVAVAVARGLRWRAAATAALLVVTGASTQVVKHLVAEPRVEGWLGHDQVGAAAWPSGHSTAAMTLALCAVFVAPPALRLVVALCGGAFAAAVGYALLVLAWHYPSDVLGGFLMAGLWAALAVAALRVVERRPAASAAPSRPHASGAFAPGLGLGIAGAGAVAAAAAAVAPGHAVALYALERPTLVAGALVIATLAGALAAGLARAE